MQAGALTLQCCFSSLTLMLKSKDLMNLERGLPTLHDIQVSLAVVLITGAPGGCILTERTHRHTRKGAVISVSVHIINSLFSGLRKTAVRKLQPIQITSQIADRFMSKNIIRPPNPLKTITASQECCLF